MGLPNCKEVTRLALEGESRPLASGERLGIRVHRLFCKGCANFGKQVDLMRKATAHWRSYSGD